MYMLLLCMCLFVSLQIYKSKLISDDFVGQASLDEIGSMQSKRKELQTWGKGKERQGGPKQAQKPYIVFVDFESSDVLTEL